MSTYWHRKDHDPEKALTDESLMPFGLHKGKKMMDVPGKYFGWIAEQPWASKWPRVMEYIKSRNKV